MLHWYGLRWRIEDWHRILKSGCKAEYLGHRTGQRIERAVTIKAVIAWRLAAMTLLGRETPEMPAKALFTQVQIRVLRHFAARRRLATPGNLGLAVRTMAILGGYLYRKNAPPPGHQKVWAGWPRLTIMAEAYELKDHFEPPLERSPDLDFWGMGSLRDLVGRLIRYAVRSGSASIFWSNVRPSAHGQSGRSCRPCPGIPQPKILAPNAIRRPPAHRPTPKARHGRAS